MVFALFNNSQNTHFFQNLFFSQNAAVKEEKIEDINTEVWISKDITKHLDLDLEPVDTGAAMAEPVETTAALADTVVAIMDLVDAAVAMADPVDTTVPMADPVDTAVSMADSVNTAVPIADPVDTAVPMADPVEPLDTAVERVEPWVRPWEDIFNDTQPEALQAVKPFEIADPVDTSVEANFDDNRPEARDIETVQSASAYKDEEDPLRRKVDLYLDLKSIHTLQYIAGRISKNCQQNFPS